MTVPIWLTDWNIKNQRNTKIVVKNVVCKGFTRDELINNKELITKVLRRVKKTGKLNNFSVTNIKLKSQHGYGPKES